MFQIPNNQELSFTFELEKYDEGSSYKFIVNSKYYNYENNISSEFYAEYKGRVYSDNIFNIKNNDAYELLSNIGKSIIYNIKNLNPIIKEDGTIYNEGWKLIHKIDLLFQDNENAFTKINLEDIFYSIVSILKDSKVELEEKLLDDLIEEKRLTISLNNENIKIDIYRNFGFNNSLYAYITYYNKKVSKKIGYNIELYINIENNNTAEITKFDGHFNYYEIFKYYKDFLEYIELLNPNKILNRIINSVIKSKNLIKKSITEYKFYETLMLIDKFINGDYNNKIKKELENSERYQNLISHLELNLKDVLKNNIEC